jgi:hypothetical protein
MYTTIWMQTKNKKGYRVGSIGASKAVYLYLTASKCELISPTHKRTEGRAPVWGSEFTSKDAALQGGIQQKPLLG